MHKRTTHTNRKQMHRTRSPVLGVRLDNRVLDALKRAAAARETTTADLVRDAIVAAIGICPTCGHDHTRPRRTKTRKHDTQAAA